MTSRQPTIAVVFLQPACNMNCSSCVTEDNFDALEPDQASSLLDRFVEQGIRSVTFGGGEPFAWRPGVLGLARSAKERGFQVQVGTNGLALPEDFATLSEVDRWVLPLESVRASIHNEMRFYRGGHQELILRRLEALRLASKPVTISTVLTRVNVDGLDDLATWLRDHHSAGGKVHAWHLYQFLPIGRGGALNRDSLSIPSEQYKAACSRIQAANLPFRIYRRTDMYRSRTVEFYWNDGGRIRSGSEAWNRSEAG